MRKHTQEHVNPHNCYAKRSEALEASGNCRELNTPDRETVLGIAKTIRDKLAKATVDAIAIDAAVVPAPCKGGEGQPTQGDLFSILSDSNDIADELLSTLKRLANNLGVE